jgi:hypothetical protein
LKFGIPQEHLTALAANHTASFGAFAWICPYNPNGGDDEKLKQAITAQIGSEPTVNQLVHYRRLHFEAHAMTIADTKIRIEKTDDVAPRKLPAPERAARHNAQMARLSNLVWSSSMEPSFALLDKLQAQLEEDVGSYVSLELCTSRLNEAEGVKKLNDPGNLSDHLLRQAFRRRALAYDQTNLIDYMSMELWTEKLYAAMVVTAPPGYNPPNRHQILIADRQLFLMMFDECRSTIAPKTDPAGNVIRPLQEAMRRIWESPAISMFLLPLPVGSTKGASKEAKADGDENPRKYGRPGTKGANSRGKGKGKGKRGKLPPILTGCWTHVKGKEACRHFNMGSCNSSAAPGASCDKGVHLCMTPGCGESHPHISCPKKTKKAE